MEIYNDPVYVKDGDISFEGNKIIIMSTTINNYFPREAIGAQNVKNVWKLYVRSNRTREALLINGLQINNDTIKVYDTNPLSDKPSERVVIKDLPANLPSDMILTFLKDQHPHITLRSKVIYAKERITREKMSPFINGDRLI